MKKNRKIKKILNPITIMVIFAVTLIAGGIGYSSINLITPVNGDFPVFAAPTNIYVKSIKSPTVGYVFASQSTKSSSGSDLDGSYNPTYSVSKDNLVAIHIINDDRAFTNSLAKHNFNIDEFNVHSKDLNHREIQTITFLADKEGTFNYYCSIHPEMKGAIVVE